MGSSKILEGAEGGERKRGREKEREGGLLMHEVVVVGGAELCRGGMQIVSICGKDRRAELAAGRCG